MIPAPSQFPAPDAVSRCRSVLLEFLSLIDQGRASRAIDLFSDDAVLDAHGECLRGHAQIDRFLTAREAQNRQTAHLITNEAIRHATADTVTISALVLLLERSEGELRPGEVLDSTQQFERHGERWLITSRRLRPLHS